MKRDAGIGPSAPRAGFAVACGLFLSAASVARAADLCEAVALYDIPAIEDPKSVLKAHEFDTGISQWRVAKTDGAASVCSHGGYCYPTSVRIDGKLVDALVLTNCRVGARVPEGDDDASRMYALEVIRSRVAPKVLAEDDADDKLLEAGLCSACASNAAHAYANAPRSRCAKAVAAALGGSKAAIAKLNDDTSLCDHQASTFQPHERPFAPDQRQ